MKNKFIVMIAIGVFVAGGVALMPGRSSADTDQSIFDKLQNQIQVLLKQVQDLQKQLELIRNGTTPVQPVIIQPIYPVTPTTPISIVCPELPKIIKFGQIGDEVKNIQKFLAQDKSVYPQGLTTGYFGPMTEKALEKFQKKYNLKETGELDDDTKDVLEKVIGPTIGSTTIGGSSGGSYSGVYFNCIIPPTPDPRPNPVPDPTLPVSNLISVNSPATGSAWQVGQTYNIAWYELLTTAASATANSSPDNVQNVSIQFEPYFSCMYPQYQDKGRSSVCMIAQPMPYVIVASTPNDGSFSWTIPQGFSWTEGRIVVSIIGQESIYGKSGVFKIYSGNSDSNKPPVISGVSGPTVIGVGEIGTWTVKAYDPENGSLSYLVQWGDQLAANLSLPLMSSEMAQTATFSHTYQNPGIYTVVITVADKSGLSAKTGLTVVVALPVTLTTSTASST